LDAPTKGAMIGGLVGGTIGALLQWGFLLFLFRNHVNAKSKLLPPVLKTKIVEPPLNPVNPKPAPPILKSKIVEPSLKPVEKLLNALVAIPCGFVTLGCALVIIFLPFDKGSHDDIGSLVGGIIGCGVFGSFFGWITYKCFKALSRKG
jgi:hypothetical protein